MMFKVERAGFQKRCLSSDGCGVLNVGGEEALGLIRF